MQRSNFFGLAMVLALAAPVSGCVINADSDPPLYDGMGTLTVEYTIEGFTGSDLCSYYGVTDAELIVYSPSGAVVTQGYAPCSSFEIGARLSPGVYGADVTLVDPSNNAMSVTKPLDDLEVFSDVELVVDMDFPPASML